MKLLEKNLQFIRQQSPDLARWIESAGVLGGRVDFDEEKSMLKLEYGSCRSYLHSLYNRKRELAEMFKDVPEKTKRLIVFGLGDGAILGYIRKNYPKLEHLVIVEPYGEVVRHFLMHHDFQKTFAPFCKLSLLVNRPMQDVVQELEQLLIGSAAIENYNSVVGLFAYQTTHSEYYREIMQATLRAIRFYRVNKTTQEAFRLLWLVNFWRNLKHLQTDLCHMASVFRGRPAILVSAGPSLNKNIHLLQAVRDKALIIAVGSAITVLENKGITPHFRVAIDGTKENELLFQKVDTKRCPLIYGDGLYFPALDGYEGPKIHMTLTSQHVPLYLFSKADMAFSVVRSGFTVANVVLDMLYKLQCSQIIIVGQDLCYTEGKLHADGSWDDEMDGAFIKQEIETENIYGEKVYTDRAFLGMKMVFENLVLAHPQAQPVINATEGGLKLEGMTHQPLQEAIDLHLTNQYDFDAEIEAALAGAEENQEERKERIQEVVSEMEEATTKLMELNEQNLREMETTLRLLMENGGRKKIIKNVEKITKTFRRMNRDEMYQQVIYPAFADKFELRRYASEAESGQWMTVLEKELQVFLSNSLELQEHLQAYRDLMADYKGTKTFNIVIK